MKFDIRPYHPADLTALYRICLKTGNNGADATDLYSDHDLPGHFYAAPYAVLEPALCFVLTADDMPVGYVLACANSAEFYQTCERHWFPPLRKRYPLPSDDQTWTNLDSWIINLIHQGITPSDNIATYPAHLHIDLMPIAQKRGFGRKLMERLWDQLRLMGVPAVELGVGRANENAVAYYRHIGFHTIGEYPWGFELGKYL